jgi:hypothetical protein
MKSIRSFGSQRPEGDYWIWVMLPADDYGRKVILRSMPASVMMEPPQH